MAADLEQHARIHQIWPALQDKIILEDYSGWLSYLDRTIPDPPPPRGATPGLSTTLALVGVLRNMKVQRSGPHPRTDHVQEMTRAEIIAKIKTENILGDQADQAILEAACLAISLWTTIKIKPSEENVRFTKVTPWAEHTTLAQLLSTTFPKIPAPSSINSQAMVIHPKLTMEYLYTFHSFDCEFTHDLSQHLHIEWASENHRKNTIMIYMHKIFLRNEILAFPGERGCSILPIDLVEETLDTLNLLFPYDEHRTRSLLRSRGQEAGIYNLAWCGRLRSLDLRNYSYWGEKIMQLSEISKGEKLGFSQLRPDRDGRNLMQTMNFWTTIWVAILTIVSAVIGGFSIVYAKWSYDVSWSAYELALAQACAEPDAGAQLPRFCR